MMARIVGGGGGGGGGGGMSWPTSKERLLLPTYDQTPSLCAREEWSGLSGSGLPAWHELVRGFKIVHEILLQTAITAPLPSKQSNNPLLLLFPNCVEKQPRDRYLLSFGGADHQGSDRYGPLDGFDCVPPAYDEQEPPPPYREPEEEGETLATRRVYHLSLKPMVKETLALFGGGLFGATERKRQKKNTNATGANKGDNQEGKRRRKAPSEDQNGGGGDASPNPGGGTGGGAGDGDGGDEKRKNAEGKLGQDGNEEGEEKKKQEEEEAKKSQVEEDAAVEEGGKPDEAAGGDTLGYEEIPKKNKKKSRKKPGEKAAERPVEEPAVVEAAPADAAGSEQAVSGQAEAEDADLGIEPNISADQKEPEDEPEFELSSKERKKREKQRKGSAKLEQKVEEKDLRKNSQREAVVETQPQEPVVQPTSAQHPHEQPIEEPRRELEGEVDDDDVDSGREGTAPARSESSKLAFNVGWGRQLGLTGSSRIWGNGWGASDTSTPNLDRSTSKSQPRSARGPPEPATAAKDKGKDKGQERARIAEKEKHTLEEVPGKGPEEVKELAPKPGREPGRRREPVSEPNLEPQQAPDPASACAPPPPGHRGPLASALGAEPEKAEDKDFGYTVKQDKKDRKAGRERNLEKKEGVLAEEELLSEMDPKRGRGKGRVMATAAVFEAKVSPTPLLRKQAGEKSPEPEQKHDQEPEPAAVATADEVASRPEPPEEVDPPPEPEDDLYGPGYEKVAQAKYADTSGIKYVPTPDQPNYLPVPAGPRYAQPKQYEYSKPLAWGLSSTKTKNTKAVAPKSPRAQAPPKTAATAPASPKTAAAAPAPMLTPAPAPALAPAPVSPPPSVEQTTEQAAPAPKATVRSKQRPKMADEASALALSPTRSPVEEDGGVGIADTSPIDVVEVEPESAPESPQPAPKRETALPEAKKSKKDSSIWNILSTPAKKSPDTERVKKPSVEVNSNGSPVKVVGLRGLLKMSKELDKRQKDARNARTMEKSQKEVISEVDEAVPELTVEVPRFEEPEIPPETPAPVMLPIESYLVPDTPIPETPQFDLGEPSPRETEFPSQAPAPKSSKKERRKKDRKFKEEPIEEPQTTPEPPIVDPDPDLTVEPEIVYLKKDRKSRRNKATEKARPLETVEDVPPEAAEEALEPELGETPAPAPAPAPVPGLIIGMLTGWRSGSGSGSAASGASAVSALSTHVDPLAESQARDHDHESQKEREHEAEQVHEFDSAPDSEPKRAMGRESSRKVQAAPAPAPHPGHSRYSNYQDYQDYPGHYHDYDRAPAPRELLSEEFIEEKPRRHRSRKHREILEDVHAMNGRERMRESGRESVREGVRESGRESVRESVGGSVREKRRHRKTSIQEPDGIPVAMERKKTHSSENVSEDKHARRERRRLKKLAEERAEQAEQERLRKEAEERLKEAEEKLRKEAEDRERIETEEKERAEKERRRAERRAKKAKKEAEREAKSQAEREALAFAAEQRERDEAHAASQQKLERRKSSRRNSEVPAMSVETREDKEARRAARRARKAAKEGRISMSLSNSGQAHHAQELARAMNGIDRYPDTYMHERVLADPSDEEYQREERKLRHRERRNARKAQEAAIWHNGEDVSGSVTPEQIPESENANNHRFSSSISNDMMEEEEQASRERRRLRKEAWKNLQSAPITIPIGVDDEEKRRKKLARKEEKKARVAEDPEARAARKATRAAKRAERENFNGGLTDYEGNATSNKKSWWKKLLG